jgi:hypothetical protein
MESTGVAETSYVDGHEPHESNPCYMDCAIMTLRTHASHGGRAGHQDSIELVAYRLASCRACRPQVREPSLLPQ